MSFRTVRSRLWLIPIFLVLLLWGCGYDNSGVVEDDDHARVDISSMPAGSAVFTTTLDEDSRSGEFDISTLSVTLTNYPRLGDADLLGGGLLAKVSTIDVIITDLSGREWPTNPFNPRAEILPNTSVAIPLDPLLPLAFKEEVFERFLFRADYCNTFYDQQDREELTELEVRLTFHVVESTIDGHYSSSYSFTRTGTFKMTHDGDYAFPPIEPYPLGYPGCYVDGSWPDVVPVVVVVP